VARPARTNPPGFPEGVEGVRRFFAMFREAMPDVEVTIDELIVDGDRAAVATGIRGTHTGELLGLPATGRRVEVVGVDMVRVRDGKIVDHRGLTDTAMLVLQRAREWTRAFFASCLFIVGLLTTMAAGLYPNLLPAREGNPHSLTIDNAAAGSGTLKAALVWWPLGMVLAAAYFVFAYRMFFRAAPKPQLGTD